MQFACVYLLSCRNSGFFDYSSTGSTQPTNLPSVNGSAMSEGGSTGAIIVLAIVMVSMLVLLLLLAVGIVVIVFFRQRFKSKATPKAGNSFLYNSSLVSFTLTSPHIRSKERARNRQML